MTSPRMQNLYIRPRHADLWDRAAKRAIAEDRSLSELVAAALTAYLGVDLTSIEAPAGWRFPHAATGSERSAGR